MTPAGAGHGSSCICICTSLMQSLLCIVSKQRIFYQLSYAESTVQSLLHIVVSATTPMQRISLQSEQW